LLAFKLPRLFAAQPENCAPIHASLAAGADDGVPVATFPTIAEGTAMRWNARRENPAWCGRSNRKLRGFLSLSA